KMNEYLEEEKTDIKVEIIKNDGEYGICPALSGIKQEDIKEDKDLLQLKEEEGSFVKTEENHEGFSEIEITLNNSEEVPNERGLASTRKN
ncbi:hypothetical protein DNTS_026986, partial [Danionella cerebrum]